MHFNAKLNSKENICILFIRIIANFFFHVIFYVNAISRFSALLVLLCMKGNKTW